jgi:hypothetical protein
MGFCSPTIKEVILRLTKEMRFKISSELINNRFDSEEEKLKIEEDQFARDVYEDLFTKNEIEILNGLPDDWFPKTSHLKVSFGDSYCYVNFLGQVKVPYKYEYNRCAKIYDGIHVFSKRYETLKDKKEKIVGEKKQLKNSIKSILDSVRTVKKLLEVWPEVKPTIDKLFDDNKENMLPAIPIKDVNKALKLG